MTKHDASHLRFFAMVCAAAMLSFGCSMFSTRETTPEGEFRQTLTNTENPAPLPVEVASDISRIIAGEKVDDVEKPFPRKQTKKRRLRNYDRYADRYADEDEDDSYDGDSEDMPRRVKRHRKSSSYAARSREDEDQDDGDQDGDGRGSKMTTPSVASTGKSGQVSHPIARHKPTGPVEDKNYVVKSGDTLMKISFEKYGNMYRWREIYKDNKSKIANLNKLVEGTVLNIKGVEYIVIHRNGNPYLIRREDTLGKISSNVYGTPKEWRGIWHNNPELIKDPNKIYAGFTLYYLPKDGMPVRTPASHSARKTAQGRAAQHVIPEQKVSEGHVPASVKPIKLPFKSPLAAKNAAIAAELARATGATGAIDSTSKEK